MTKKLENNAGKKELNKVDKELLEMYKNEAEKALKLIRISLRKIKENHSNQKEIFNFYRGAHTLKSSSFQMGFYSVGYLAHLMSNMLKEIKIKKIKLDDEKIAFLDDFSGTLEKAVAYVLKNKEIKFSAKLFDEVESIIGRTEKERLKNAEFELQKQVETKENEELFNLYIQTTDELISEIQNCLENIKKNKYKEQINKIIVSSHTLEGNSLQAKEYLLGYFSSRLNSYCKEILEKSTDDEIGKEQIAYLLDLLGTLKIYFNSLKNKKKMLREELTEKLNALIKQDYFEMEKRLRREINDGR